MVCKSRCPRQTLQPTRGQPQKCLCGILRAALSLPCPCSKPAGDMPASVPELGGGDTLWAQLNLGSVTQQGSFGPPCFLAVD